MTGFSLLLLLLLLLPLLLVRDELLVHVPFEEAHERVVLQQIQDALVRRVERRDVRRDDGQVGHLSGQHVEVELVRRADGHVVLVQLPRHLGALLRGVAVAVLPHLQDEVQVLLRVLALKEGAEQGGAI